MMCSCGRDADELVQARLREGTPVVGCVGTRAQRVEAVEVALGDARVRGSDRRRGRGRGGAPARAMKMKSNSGEALVVGDHCWSSGRPTSIGGEGRGMGSVVLLDVLAAYRVERGRGCGVWVLLVVCGGDSGLGSRDEGCRGRTR